MLLVAKWASTFMQSDARGGLALLRRDRTRPRLLRRGQQLFGIAVKSLAVRSALAPLGNATLRV
jgi:hypothetical protein